MRTVSSSTFNPFAPIESSLFQSTRHFLPCRSIVADSLSNASVLLLKQGAVLEKVQLCDLRGPLVRVAKPGEVLLGCQLCGPPGSYTASLRAIHLHGTFLQSWSSSETQESGFGLPPLHEWYRETLNSCLSRILGLQYYSAHHRLASLLIDLSKTFGLSRADGGILLPLRLSIKDFAECIGSTRETASIGLNRFKRNKLALQEGGMWVIFPQALEGYQDKL